MRRREETTGEGMLNRHNFEIAKLAPKDSKDLSRFEIPGILVSPDQTAETNGRQLIIVSGTAVKSERFPVGDDGFQPLDDFAPFLVGREQALKIAKAIPKGKPLPVLDHAAIGRGGVGLIKIVTTDLKTRQIFEVEQAGQYFPCVDAVVPDKDQTQLTIHFNLDMLVPVLQQMRTFAREGRARPTVAFRFRGAGGGVRIDAENTATGQTMTAVVMPCKV